MSRYMRCADGEYRLSLTVEQHPSFDDVTRLLAVGESAFGEDLDDQPAAELRDIVRHVLTVRGWVAATSATPTARHREHAIRAFGAPPVETTTPKGEHL